MRPERLDGFAAQRPKRRITMATPAPAPADPNKINVQDKADLESWAKVFGVTFTQVRAAVAIVGPNAEAVRKYLKK